jgi:two-component system CheB/CheR fusion protein
MPRSAIGTGDVDLILPVDQIIGAILAIAQNAAAIQLPTPSDPEPTEELTGGTSLPVSDARAIDEVLETLRARTRHDFSNYKRGTVMRRIERRMQVNAMPTAVAYRDFLDGNVDETPKLLADMLIGVTNFFRDPDAFAALERTALPQLLADLQGRDELRAWVPACATGEEAFSIAILLDEAVRRLPNRPRVSVYASDIDARAISIARTASYPQAIENDISPERLSQYFHKDGNRYRLSKSLRDTVIFAAHNLLRDPPFSRIDLVSCRNVLIYLDRRAQTRVLQTFHFSLAAREGFLFLGTAESADFANELFAPVQKQQRIYRARPNAIAHSLASHGDVSPPVGIGGETFFNTLPEKPSDTKLPSQARAHDLFGPPIIVIRADGTIVHRSTNANRLTEDARRTRVINVFEIVRSDAHARVRHALQRCLTTARREDEASVPFMTASGEIAVDLSFRPYRDRAHQTDLVSITCDLLASLPDDSLVEGAPATREQEQQEQTVDSLRQALEGSEDLLRDSMQHQQSSNEALRASNEELQAMNEELRSATEELEASREELQSLNEELMTVNSELSSKVQESARVSDDLKNLISLVGVATVFVDRALNIKRYTSPAETLFNIRPGDEGRPLQHLTHGLDYPDMFSDLGDAFESLKRSEKEVRSRDGRTFLARVLPYRTDDDRIDGAVLALIDISEQKAAQDQAEASEEKLRLAARETHDFAIIVLDDDGTIVSWNVGAAHIFGFTAEEALSKPLDLIFTPEDIADSVPSRERERAAAQGRAEDDRWHRTKNGRLIFCSGFLSRITAPAFSGFAKIVHDATDRRLADSKKDQVLERERADNTEIRKLCRLKDEFIAVLSHELKNPLNLIHVKAEILARLPEARTSGRIQQVADAIQKSVLTQAQIIDDLLDFSRIQTGKLSLRLAPTDITSIVRSISSAMQDDFQKSEIRLELDIPSTHLIIRGDAVRVEQIIWNLLSNALKFTPSDGQIRVRLQQEAGTVKVEVADTGCGIAPEALASVFEMFEQTPNIPFRARTGGLGIGLSLVRQLAELHGGRAEAFSDGEGRGARFVVTFPADASFANRKAGDRAADLAVFDGAHVLLVEDSDESLQAMAELFSLYGAQASTSANAADALAMAEKTLFDIVVTDVNLPDMDGYHLVAQMRKLNSFSSIPIVAITGRPVNQEEALAREAGCDACLPKPFNLQALADVVRRCRRFT